MSDNLGLGRIIEGPQQRDAVHVAVVPVTAGEDLEPGMRVGQFPDCEEFGELEEAQNHVGIVDPFLHQGPKKGERFWLFLFPNTVTSLKHFWTHPAFEDEGQTPKDEEAAKGKRWLAMFADELDLSYDDLMAALKEYTRTGHPHIFQGFDTLQGAYEKSREAWLHYQLVTGEKVDDIDGVPFSCSC
jgi:hypothetical protein